MATSPVFEIGVQPSVYTLQVSTVPVNVSISDTQAVSVMLEGLQPNTTYYYRLTTTAPFGGTLIGQELSFKTLAPGDPTQTPVLPPATPSPTATLVPGQPTPTATIPPPVSSAAPSAAVNAQGW
ncbi:MAG: hypothetical protein U0556_07600 [Dehalococcoidia bacterium]